VNTNCPDEETNNAPEVKDLNNKMLNPVNPHLVQGRAVEIRKSDGNKPNDSFIVKKNEENESDDRLRKSRKDSRKRNKEVKDRKRHSRRSRSRSSRSISRSSNSSWSFEENDRRRNSQDKVSNDNLVKNC
jgi:hypothetical protein